MLVYRLYDEQNTLLYVGITSQVLRRRVTAHFSRSWGRDIARYESDEVPDDEARLIERQVIKALRPLHNVEHAVGYASTNARAREWVRQAAEEQVGSRGSIVLTEVRPNTRYGIAKIYRYGRPSQLAHRPATIYAAWHSGRVVNVGGRMECGGLRPSLTLTNSTEGMKVCQRCVDSETERLREEDLISC